MVPSRDCQGAMMLSRRGFLEGMAAAA